MAHKRPPQHFPDKREKSQNDEQQIKTLNTLLSAISEFILMFDKQGRFLFANESAAKLLGRKQSDFIGTTWQELGMPAEFMETFDVHRRIAMATGQPEIAELSYPIASEMRWLGYVVKPIVDEHGEVESVVVSAKDISEQKRMVEELERTNNGLHQQREELTRLNLVLQENYELQQQHQERLQAALHRAESSYALLERTKSQLRAIIDASQDAMLFLSPSGRPMKVNTRFTDFFGLDDTTVLSQSPAQLMALLKGVFEDSDALEQSLPWSTKDQQHIFRAHPVQREPTRREFDLSSLPVINANQTYQGRLYVWHDSTHERAVDRMKSEFVSLVSHELRTPLTSIKGYIDLLLTDEAFGDLSELQREFLGIVQHNARRLVSLINDLLDLSRLESGKIELHRKPLDVNQLVEELMPSFQPGWLARRQAFTLHLPEQTPIVLGDADRVMQILSNLLSNAHKYTPEEGHIDLSVEAIGTVASIAVTDSGIGLSSEEQAHLFTRFYRAHNATTEAVGGTGLGLVITRSLVEMQGGEIEVSSEPGRGSTFRFTLPLAQPPEPAASPRESVLGKRILVVDDEPDIRHLLQRYLESGGYEVLMASGGEEALHLASTARPDLITLDMLLPDSSGLTVLERLKSDASTASIPVLMLTIVDDDGQGRLLGATDYLDKPIKAADLLQRIATVFADQSEYPMLLANHN